MGNIDRHPDVKLIAGFIFSDNASQLRAQHLMVQDYGPIDHHSDIFAFNKTSYYDEEMGRGLKKKFVSFLKMRPVEDIEDVKIYTNKLEDIFKKNNKRVVNIDPGYVTESKVVLFTTKNFQHRIYISKGIFAEATLMFKKGSYIPCEWTYPDFRTEEYINFFNIVRRSIGSRAHAA